MALGFLLESCLRPRDFFLRTIKMKDELAAGTSLENHRQGDDSRDG